MSRRSIIFIAGCCCACMTACAFSRPSAPLATEVRPYKFQGAPDQNLVQQWSERFEFSAFTSPNGFTLPYRLMRPSVPRRAPLVVILHGSGAIGTDNRSQLGAFAGAWAQSGIGTAMIVVPQVAERSANYRIDRDGLPSSVIGPSFPALLELVDALSRDPAVDPRRVHLVGFSMGGSAVLQLALARPGKFASITAFSPVPPPRNAARRLAGESVTLVHGDADAENPLAADSAWVEALRASGGRPRLVLYRGMDHRVPPDMMTAADWRAALLARRNR